ncbi:phospholipase A2 inhibitor gamma subunit B [Lepisosteus oculatus]|uniref:phospholipase A2 inhibitor gamma subunit B n=1 Tax=Lepisosteus oculatus TaxID=7918 RepID=UPI0037100535
MKMLGILALTCALFPLATGLSCNQCLPTSISPCIQVTCLPAFTKCFTGTLKATGITDLTVKSCMLPEVCTGDPFSINTGALKLTAKLDCCSTDNCNSNTPPAAYTDTTPSGLKCYYCDGTVCNKTLTCQGVENRCFTGSGSVNDQTQTYMGCVSDNTCKAYKTDLSKILNQIINFNFNMTCCSGNLCNNAMRTGQSVFLLLVPLAFIKLFN